MNSCKLLGDDSTFFLRLGDSVRFVYFCLFQQKLYWLRSGRASALSAGSSHTQINIDLPVFESRRPVTANQRMRMAAAEDDSLYFF